MQQHRLRLISLFIIIMLIIVACDDAPASAKYITLSVQETHKKFSNDDQAIIVDVRNPEEWTATGVPVGAVLISLPEFEQRAPAELPKDQPVYVICNSGNRSQTASQNLIDMGYKNVINVDGGIQAWLRAGLPIESYTP